MQVKSFGHKNQFYSIHGNPKITFPEFVMAMTILGVLMYYK